METDNKSQKTRPNQQDIMSEINLLDIQSDYVFKRVFGIDKNKKLLISLLNAILKGHPQVMDLELQNTEISKLLKDNRTIRLDIVAKIDPHHFVNIEMQVCNTGEIPDRAVQHGADLLALHSNLPTNEEKQLGIKSSYAYPKVISIWIMGHNFLDRDGAVNEANISFPPTGTDDYQIISDKLRLIFIELPKFHPKRIDLKDMLNVWITFLKDPLNQEIQEVSEIRQALNTLKEISEDPDTREYYRLCKRDEMDRMSELSKAHEEGEKAGMERGMNEKAFAVAKAMLQHGDDIEYIARVSGLNADMVNELKVKNRF